MEPEYRNGEWVRIRWRKYERRDLPNYVGKYIAVELGGKRRAWTTGICRGLRGTPAHPLLRLETLNPAAHPTISLALEEDIERIGIIRKMR